MSIYAVIGSGFTDVPRREMNGSAHQAFPLITCASSFEERQDAVNDLIKRLEDIVMNAEDDVVLSTYSQTYTPFGNIDSNMTFSKTVFDEGHPDANLTELRTCLETYRHDHVEVEVGGDKATYAIICIKED